MTWTSCYLPYGVILQIKWHDAGKVFRKLQLGYDAFPVSKFLGHQRVCVCQSLSCARLFATPWTIARQAPLFMEFSRQEYWNRLPFPPPRDMWAPGTELTFPALAGGSLPVSHLGNPCPSIPQLLIFFLIIMNLYWILWNALSASIYMTIYDKSFICYISWTNSALSVFSF